MSKVEEEEEVGVDDMKGNQLLAEGSAEVYGKHLQIVLDTCHVIRSANTPDSTVLFNEIIL